jgi:hypothetical protein
MKHSYRPEVVLSLLGLLLSGALIAILPRPFYTDAFYYYNAGENLAAGRGLSDDYLWVYINVGEALPTESHRYWMPLSSIVAALPMALLGEGYPVAQIGFIPFYLAGLWLSLALSRRLSSAPLAPWVAGCLYLFGGFYLPFWLAVDSFALYAALGGGALLALGRGAESPHWRWAALAGAMSGLAHLARADGLLFLIVGGIVILGPSTRAPWRQKIPLLGALLGAYLLIMAPWFARNMAIFGAPLPAGGVNTVFLRGYEDIFSYKADWGPTYWLDWGAENVLRSRWEGLLVAFQTWLAVETLIILGPFGLGALYLRRREAFWAPVIWYALGLHLAMSVVFTYPGMRGGLFHSSAALFPFWIALGLEGLQGAIAWIGAKRAWNIPQAQTVFSLALILLPGLLGLSVLAGQAESLAARPDYTLYVQDLPPGSRIMVNDPAAWHYHTDLSGVTLPDDPLPVALEIAQKYCLTHLIIDKNVTESFVPLFEQTTPPPDWLQRLPAGPGGDALQLYAFIYEVDAEQCPSQETSTQEAP